MKKKLTTTASAISNSLQIEEGVYSQIRQVLQTAREKAYRSVNFIMVEAYWNVGRLIVQEEQKGKGRADYGERIVEDLAGKLTNEFGKGFTRTNLWYMRQFYLAFPILHAVRGELSWTHYRLLLKVEKEDARTLIEEGVGIAHAYPNNAPSRHCEE